MKVLNYDTECTGLEKPFEAPLQFAAKLYDTQGGVLTAVNLRGRPPRHILPSPAALAVTGLRISSVLAQPASAYEFACEVHKFFEANAPAVVTGFNIIAYDEEILRHTFYANLLHPYVSQFGGNERLDILLAMKAAIASNPNAYNLPINEKGKRSFKLEHIAEAFGYQEHAAHDALGDVDAAMYVANTIRSRTPDVWRSTHTQRSKSKVSELLSARLPIVCLGWNHTQDKQTSRVLLPVCPDTEILTKWWCVNLAANPHRIIDVEPSDLVRAFKSSSGTTAIVGVATNKMPLVFAMDDPSISGINVEFDRAFAAQLSSDSSLAARICEASRIRRGGYDEKTYVQDQLYSGGLFPQPEDRDLMEAFRVALPAQKYEILSSFDDPRARALGKLLIGSEWPAVMSTGDRSAYFDELNQRMMTSSGPWMSVPKALAEIQSLRPAIGNVAAILDEYEAYLLRWSLDGATYAAE